MRYMLLLYRDEAWWEAKPEAERTAIRQLAVEAAAALRQRGVYVSGDPLLPTHTATTVRMRSGKAVTTDGPFAETKEQLGGYNILDVPSLDEALAIAAEHPLLRVGGHSIEVRPIRKMPPLATE